MGRICYDAFMEGKGTSWEDAPPNVREKFERIGARIQAAMGAHSLKNLKAVETHKLTLSRLDASLRGEAGC